MKTGGPRANTPSNNQANQYSIISVKISSQLIELQLHVCYGFTLLLLKGKTALSPTYFSRKGGKTSPVTVA